MPDVQELPDDIESIASTAEDDHHLELLLAGFRACAKEAIRFLLEEEGLSPDHALPLGLQEHLDRKQSHLAGMIQNDSGLDIDESLCCSSADDASFLSNETSDVDCNYDTLSSKDDIISNASMNCSSRTNTDCHMTESMAQDSNDT